MHTELQLSSEEALDLLEALQTYLTEETVILSRTDVHVLQRELHRKLDRIESVRNRLRSAIERSASPHPEA